MRKASRSRSVRIHERATATDDQAASLAGYIAELTEELARLAERSELTMLAYFLNLARVEAEMRSRELSNSSAGVASDP